MNQKQREYVISKVKGLVDDKIDKLRKSRKERPSLNNYIVAGVLDGTIKMKNQEQIREHIRDLVLKLGAGENFVDSQYSYRSKRADSGIKLSVRNVFELPESYLEREKEVDDWNAEIDQQIETLKAEYATVEMKLNLGSDKQFSYLLDEVDNMGDLQLINNAFRLDNKQLT
jgi:hypothetical protein